MKYTELDFLVNVGVKYYHPHGYMGDHEICKSGFLAG